MMIEFECPCGVRLEVSDDQKGRDFECPKCGGMVRAPVSNASVEFGEVVASSDVGHKPPAAGIVVVSRGWMILLVSLAVLPSALLIVVAALFWNVIAKPQIEGNPVIVEEVPKRTGEDQEHEIEKKIAPPKEATLGELIEKARQGIENTRSLRVEVEEARQQMERSRRIATAANISVGMMLPEEMEQIKVLTAQARENLEDRNAGRAVRHKFSKNDLEHFGHIANVFGREAYRQLEEAEGENMPKNTTLDVGRMLPSEIQQLQTLTEQARQNQEDRQAGRTVTYKISRFFFEKYGGIDNEFGDEAAVALTDDEIEKALAIAKNRMRAELQSMMDKVNAAKAALKQAQIADDKKAAEKQVQAIKRYQTELRQFAEAPFKSLDATKLKTGQIGDLAPYSLTVRDVPGHGSGVVCRIFSVEGALASVCKFVGFDIAPRLDLAPGNRLELNSQTKFIVVGTTNWKYPYVLNKALNCSDTIFELHFCEAPPTFTVDELTVARDVADPNYTITLTDEEETRANATREANASAEREKNRIASARRSESYLNMGKQLLKKGNRPDARKQFEKAVAEDPDCDTAKEAAKLLENLP